MASARYSTAQRTMSVRDAGKASRRLRVRQMSPAARPLQYMGITIALPINVVIPALSSSTASYETGSSVAGRAAKSRLSCSCQHSSIPRCSRLPQRTNARPALFGSPADTNNAARSAPTIPASFVKYCSTILSGESNGWSTIDRSWSISWVDRSSSWLEVRASVRLRIPAMQFVSRSANCSWHDCEASTGASAVVTKRPLGSSFSPMRRKKSCLAFSRSEGDRQVGKGQSRSD